MIDSFKVNENIDAFSNMLTEMANMFADKSEDFVLTPDVDTNGYLAALNNMIHMTGMTTDEINALFDIIGYQPSIKTEKVQIDAT